MNTTILESSEVGDIPIDIYQKLSSEKMLFISDFVNDKVATNLVATLLLKDSAFDSKKSIEENKISLFINSEGGDIRSIFMIYDIIKMMKSPIETICVGSAMNEIIILLAAGTPGLRMATPSAIISSGHLLADESIYSNLTDAKSLMDRINNDNKSFLQILSKCTKQPYKKIFSDFERKKFFNPTQAINYGIIDFVVKKFF